MLKQTEQKINEQKSEDEIREYRVKSDFFLKCFIVHICFSYIMILKKL